MKRIFFSFFFLSFFKTFGKCIKKRKNAKRKNAKNRNSSRNRRTTLKFAGASKPFRQSTSRTTRARRNRPEHLKPRGRPIREASSGRAASRAATALRSTQASTPWRVILVRFGRIFNYKVLCCYNLNYIRRFVFRQRVKGCDF